MNRSLLFLEQRPAYVANRYAGAIAMYILPLEQRRINSASGKEGFFTGGIGLFVKKKALNKVHGDFVKSKSMTGT